MTDKTFADLTAVTTLNDSDLCAVYPTGGPLKKITRQNFALQLFSATPLSVAQGGTGAATATDARNNLGLSSMALQDAAAVAITGGTIAGLTSLAVTGTTVLGPSVTKPTSPAFFVQLSADLSAKTGDGTTYTVAFDSEIFDRHSDFAAGAFTAPYTGIYALAACLEMTGVLTANTVFLMSISVAGTSARTYNAQFGDIQPDANGRATLALSVPSLLMTAGDTATVLVNVQGNGSKNIGFLADGAGGTATPTTWFSGVMLG